MSDSSMGKRREFSLIKAFVATPAVERFDETRFELSSGLNEVQANFAIACPTRHCQEPYSMRITSMRHERVPHRVHDEPRQTRSIVS